MDYHIPLHSNPMSKHYYLLYFADKKSETSYLLRGKTRIQAAGYKAPDPNPHALYCTVLHLVEQAIYIFTILGPYFTLGHYMQWISPKNLFPHWS